jgi:predicted membrane chloride channel (bestrophin family)
MMIKRYLVSATALVCVTRAPLVSSFVAPTSSPFGAPSVSPKGNGERLHSAASSTSPAPPTYSTEEVRLAHQRNGTLLVNDDDSIEEFEKDVATVLKVLRPGEKDPTIPALFRRDLFPSFCHTWSLKDWDVHTTRWRYVRFILYFPTSRLARRILPQLSIIVSWSAIVSYLCSRNVGVISKVSLPLTPLSLVSTFVAALLTLRSNQGLDRLNMGRLSFGKAVLYTRDAASLIVTMIYPKNPQLALKLLRHVALYGWLLKGFLRGPQVNGDDQDIIGTMLRNNQDDVDYVLAQRKSPMAVVMRVRQVVQYLSDRHVINTAEELALDHTTQELNHCLMTTERIRASPIPPLYTSHTGRLLMFYLFFLPLALCGSGMDGLATVLTTSATAYAMLGLDEISFLLEQPFRLMPLFQLCKNSMTDVADTIVIRPPPIPSQGLDVNIESAAPSALGPMLKGCTARPSYW